MIRRAGLERSEYHVQLTLYLIVDFPSAVITILRSVVHQHKVVASGLGIQYQVSQF